MARHPDRLTVGIVGDFQPANSTHVATNDSLDHAAAGLSVELERRWIPTEALDTDSSRRLLEPLDGIWIAPASPYRSMGGALAAIRFAREGGRPLVGT